MALPMDTQTAKDTEPRSDPRDQILGISQDFLLKGVWLSAFAVGLVALYLTTQSKTPTKGALSAILLTFMSVLLSWILSHYYATRARREEIDKINEAHEKSLRMYALKAAEKVMNLSRELDRLSSYLVAYRDAEEDESLPLVLRSKDERITGAIHIVAMLRSVNDTALSDWEGVIGTELDEKREEEKEEREEYLDDLISKVDLVVESVKALGNTNPATAETIRKEFHEVRNELIAALLGGATGSKPKLSVPTRLGKYFNAPCPTCETALRVRLSSSGRVRIRGYRCPKCMVSLVAGEDAAGEPKLSLRSKIPEEVECPECGSKNSIEIDNLAGVTVNFACNKCEKGLYAFRSNEGIGVRIGGVSKESFSIPMSLTPDFVERVRTELPAQPWPTGVHKKVAERLSVPASKVQKAIKVLILSGVFKHQVDGAVISGPTHPV